MSTAVAEKRLTASDLVAAVRARYEPPEWHLESEVTLAGRRLDVVALNLWAARQWRIVGFEIKVSRGDWLRELDAFQKSEEWCAVVDAFYVVTPPKLVRDGELPEGWGLLELNGSRMMTRRHATTREGRTTIPREIAARFIGRAADEARRQDRTAEWQANEKLRAEIKAKVEEQTARELQDARTAHATTQREYTELLLALGVRPHEWHHHQAAMRVAGIFANATTTGDSLRRLLDENARRLESLAAQMRSAITDLSGAPTEETATNG